MVNDALNTKINQLLGVKQMIFTFKKKQNKKNTRKDGNV